MRHIIAMLDNIYFEVQEYALESEDKEKVLEKISQVQNQVENLYEK